MHINLGWIDYVILAAYTAFVVGCLGLAGEARGTEVFVNKESQTVVLTIR